MLEMHVVAINVDPNTGAAVLMLQGTDGDGRSLPICIGMAEASAIAQELQQVKLARPLTHDLLRNVVRELGAEVLRVEVVALRESTYFAELVVHDAGGGERRIDSRPSDAIALAVRCDAPILVREELLDVSGEETPPEPQEIPWAADKDEWSKILERMRPGDFGKYKI